MAKILFDEDTPIGLLTVGELKRIIQSIVQDRTVSATPIPKYDTMSVTEVAEMSGYSKATIYKLVCERKIPHHKPSHGGRKTVFLRTEVSEWLQARKIETLEQYAIDQEQLLTHRKFKR